MAQPLWQIKSNLKGKRTSKGSIHQISKHKTAEMLNSWSQISWAGLDRVFSCFRQTLLQNPPHHRPHTVLWGSNGSLLLLLIIQGLLGRTTWLGGQSHTWLPFYMSKQMTQDLTAQLKNHLHMPLPLNITQINRVQSSSLQQTEAAWHFSPLSAWHSASSPALICTPVLPEWTNTFDWQHCWEANIPDRL